jgi:DNA replication protein DnaC
LVGDVPTAAAILDRFLHHARVVTFTGKSFRFQNSGNVSKAPAA